MNEETKERAIRLFRSGFTPKMAAEKLNVDIKETNELFDDFFSKLEEEILNRKKEMLKNRD